MSITVGQLRAALKFYDFKDEDEVVLAWEEFDNSCYCDCDCGTDMGRDVTADCVAMGELVQKKAKNPKNKLILGATSYMTTGNTNQKINQFEVK